MELDKKGGAAVCLRDSSIDLSQERASDDTLRPPGFKGWEP